MPITVVPGGAPAAARAARSGAQDRIRSKCGRTRRCGRTPRPGSGSLAGGLTAENVAGLRVSQAYRREERNTQRFAGRSESAR